MNGQGPVARWRRAAGGPGRAAPWPRVATGIAAALVALVLTVAPPSARTALAATDPLRTEAHATYTLDPDAGRVHVAIEITETDLKPNTAQFEYFYTAFGFALQPEASSVRVSGGSAKGVTTRARDGYIEARVSIGKALFYRQSTTFTIRYELVGGKPRSDTPTRVGAAYSTFGVWAWGDPGRGTVEVRTPDGFDTRFSGGSMQVTSSPTTGQILRAEPGDPSKFFAIVTAENNDAYTETRISLEGGVEIVVQSWPEDLRWKADTSGILTEVMPVLRTLIGLDWPVAHDLDVRERYTPDLEGYAGFFLTEQQRIEVSEDLDPVTIVHEASHAWFNDSLFLERWIYEGLAEDYAWRALREAGIENGDDPETPDLDDPGFSEIETWTHPGVIKDQETDDRERYGYQAAFWVIHAIVEAAGAGQMRDAFANAHASVTAYPGAGEPEGVSAGDSWRRLLDLTEPIDKPDPAAVHDALRSFVLGTADERALDAREAARAAYRALLQRGEWLPGWYVRGPMGDWAFDLATTRMAEAAVVLDLRDRVATAAEALGLQPDGALRTAYEGAKDGLADATAVGEAQLGALGAIADAKAGLDRPADLVAQVGLLGETPATSYDAARAAFTAGNTGDALALAEAASATFEGATAVGQQRLVIAAGTALGALLLVVLLVVLARRRRGRSRAQALAVASGPAPGEPYATLAADPAPDHDVGGQAPG